MQKFFLIFFKSSTSWYLGYVEDGESVEMIEKKFELLEQYNKQSLTSPEQKQQSVVPPVPDLKDEPELSEQQMEDMFKITSYFSIKDTSPLSAPLESNDMCDSENRYLIYRQGRSDPLPTF